MPDNANDDNDTRQIIHDCTGSVVFMPNKPIAKKKKKKKKIVKNNKNDETVY